MANYNVANIESALVVGAGHGIGLALVTKLIHRQGRIKVVATYNNADKAHKLFDLAATFPENLSLVQLDPLDESQIVQLFAGLKAHHHRLDLLVNCVGLLHDEQVKPEKSLKTIDHDQLLKYFSVNAIVTPVLAKHGLELLKTSPLAVFATVSAKVGSIEDNKMGGWYGYRASKAALNMFIRNIAVEYSHRNSHCIVLALHPGTTITELSQPYIQRTKLTLHTADETAANLLSVIDGKELKDSGSFYSWQNQKLPW